ncbi:MAG: 2'-5' RNA ligase family protein [Anaerolineaceae bacterium]|nr:2'-5' RNA ligase family protein [Anaerolineaceae bacterium]
MPIGAALTFDRETEAAVRGLWQAQVDAGLPSVMAENDYPPHMTLLLAEEGDFNGLRDAFTLLSREIKPLPVDFLSLGLFAAEYGVVYLAPVVNHALLDLHSTIWNGAVPHLARLYDYYQPGVWVPHVTLANRLTTEYLGPATSLLSSSSWPRSGTINSILFGDFQPGGVSYLETVYLKGL